MPVFESGSQSKFGLRKHIRLGNRWLHATRNVPVGASAYPTKG